MRLQETVDIEIRETDKKYHFYIQGRWVQGCRKCYLFDVMQELAHRYSDEYPVDVKFYLGGYEDEKLMERSCN